MKPKKIYSIIFVLVLAASVLGQKADWYKKIEGIEMLKSKREDVIKTFGKPNESAPYSDYYSPPFAKLKVEYSKGLCGNKNQDGWNVPKSTVIKITYSLFKKVTPKDLDLDLSKFEKSDADIGGYIYKNKDLGINLLAFDDGDIAGISLYPSSKFDYLRCKK